MELIDSIKSIFEGNVLLFTGAGFSLSAKNTMNNKIRSAYYLSEYLYNECGEDNDGDLENAVDVFLDKYGELKLINFLKNEFTVSETSKELDVFGTVNWKRIYTTNYDNVIETVFQKNKKAVSTVTLADRVTDFDKTSVCIHLNGSINNLDTDTLNSEFKLTNVSYLTQSFLESEWVDLFRIDVSTSDAIFFVGFSMKYDLDIKRILFAKPELRDKCFFVVAENEPEKNLRLISKFGTPLPIGLEKFSQLIVAEKENYIPITKIEHYFSFKKIGGVNDKTLPVLKDKDVFDLFIEGRLNNDLIPYSIQLPQKYPYFVYRTKYALIKEEIEKGKKNVVIHSDLGNGKTLYIKGLGYYLSQEGYKVYEYDKFYSPIYRELESICKDSDEKTVLIIDNYTNDWQLLEVLRLHRKKIILIITERTLVYDVTSDKLESIIGEYLIFDINKLDDNEIDILVDLFNKYGFWKYLSSSNIHIKRKFIERTCEREFRNFLLKLLDSPDILHRFETVIFDIKNKKGFYEALVFILVSQIYGFKLDLEDLIYTLGYDVINNSSFENNIQIKEFIDFEKGEINVKSSILSIVILSKIVDSYIIVDVLLKIFQKLDKHRFHKPYRDILKSLVSFTNLQRVLNKNDRSYKHNMLRYFEGIKNMDFCKSNPHFWLQYAIEKLSEQDYFTAKTYFDTAYSYANKLGNYDTYQIDNHYARYILENIIENGEVDTCMENFTIAHNILMDPIHEKEVKYYPYRVAQNYFPFYEKFYSKLPETQKKIFIKSCEEILEKVEKYIEKVPKYANSREVKNAKEKINYVLSDYQK